MSPIKTEDYILSQDPCTGEYSLTLRNSGETLSITDEVGQYLKKNFYHEQYTKRLHRKKCARWIPRIQASIQTLLI